MMKLDYRPLLSATPQINVYKVSDDIKAANPRADVEILDWPSYEEIVLKLASNLINVFPYNDHCSTGRLYGISAAVRMAFAAKRPVIVSHCSQFKDLKEYQDEVYFIEGGLSATIERVQNDIREGKERIPNRILQDMNWVACADKYAKLYRELASDIVA
jgi:glycosyltransferase involved in cell wall biosynthesis